MATITASKGIRAFLDLLAKSEGTSGNPFTRADGYDVIVTGVDGHHTFTDYSGHPFQFGRAPIIVRTARPAQAPRPDPTDSRRILPAAPAVEELRSTASGRYQLTLETWQHLSTTFHVGSFSPANQDLCALHLLDECGAAPHIAVGDIPGAMARAAPVWASLPGSLYGQPTHTVDQMLQWYTQLLAQQQ